MATNTNLINLSKQLASKLGDRVTQGDADGVKYTAELRANYLSRGFTRLRRIARSFVDDVSELFSDYYSMTTATGVKAADGVALGVGSLSHKIFDLFAVTGTTPEDMKVIPATRLDPKTFFRLQYEDSSYHKPSATSFFYSVIGDKVRYLPAIDLLAVQILFSTATDDFDYATEGRDIKIPAEYNDLLLTLAAQEAMYDAGDTNKAQAYMGDIKGQIELIQVISAQGKEDK